MKLRIKGDSIRLRLSQTEVQNFGTEGYCEDQTNFPGKVLSYRLQKADTASLSATFNGNKVLVEVPQSVATKWVEDPSQVGFDYEQELGDGAVLRILVEKDFACLAERPHEDESDNFPNPMAAEGGKC